MVLVCNRLSNTNCKIVILYFEEKRKRKQQARKTIHMTMAQEEKKEARMPHVEEVPSWKNCYGLIQNQTGESRYLKCINLLSL